MVTFEIQAAAAMVMQTSPRQALPQSRICGYQARIQTASQMRARFGNSGGAR
jgi:hypothetical protein